MSNSFPEHWASFNMLDIINYEGGSQPPKKDFIYEPKKGYIRLIQIRDYGNNPFPTYVPVSLKLKLTEEDDIMIARYGGSAGSDSLGRICEGIKGAYNVALTKVIYPKSILPRSFVKYLLDGPWLKERLNSLSRSCQSGFNRDDLGDLVLPLPPLNEQKRMVEKLDALLPKVKSAKARLEKIPAILKKFRQSVLATACSGRLTEDWRHNNQNPTVNTITDIPEEILFDIPDTWQWTKWNGVVSKNKHSFKRGPFGSALKKEIFVKKGYKVYEQCCPINDNCSLGDYYITEQKYKELIAFKVKAGDLLISCSGVTLGRITEVPENYEEGIINQALLKIEFDPTKIINSYFIKYFRSKHFQKLIFDNAQGSAQPNIIGVKELKILPIPLPPLEEQIEIVRRVEKLFALADSLEAKYKKAFARVDKIEQSILAKAFRGELVEPDPDDEPAEELLKRIMEEKAKLEGGKKKKKIIRKRK